MNEEHCLMDAIVAYVAATYGREGVSPQQWEEAYWLVEAAIRSVFDPEDPRGDDPRAVP